MGQRLRRKVPKASPDSTSGFSAYARAFAWLDGRRSRQASAESAEQRLEEQARRLHQKIADMDAEMTKLRRVGGDDVPPGDSTPTAK